MRFCAIVYAAFIVIFVAVEVGGTYGARAWTVGARMCFSKPVPNIHANFLSRDIHTMREISSRVLLEF